MTQEIRYKLFTQSRRHVFNTEHRESESTSHMKALEQKSDIQDKGINCLKRKLLMTVVLGVFTLRSTGLFRRLGRTTVICCLLGY
jgi:hypothetical protein